MTKALAERGDQVTVFDNLSKGHKDVVDARAKLVIGDITDNEGLASLFQEQFDAAIHFAGLIAVGESEEKPELYFHNNVEGSKLFFQMAIDAGVNNFIFSSSAAVYGNPTKIPIPEDHTKSPTSEYGRNKLEIEQSLLALREGNPKISFAALRYFNAAGASLDGSMGEGHWPETHLIPNVILSFLNKNNFNLFGTDYNTKDGTCVRDYIHVLDLVEAHMLALDKLSEAPGGYFYNVGSGDGYSNREVIDMVESVSGKKIMMEEKERRAGDADTLIADPSKIREDLGFTPKYSDLETIVKSAWQWHSK